ncbi:hypothetical protein A2U01_0119278, partial [Trifolium medium]|nr:hypothetical protein [Trifolium medium]
MDIRVCGNPNKDERRIGVPRYE